VAEPGLALATFSFALAGGLVPFLNVEAYLLVVAVAVPRAEVLPLVVAAAAGQVAAKALLYGAGLGALRPSIARRPRLEGAVARLAGAGTGARGIVFASALLGVPPFYAVSVAAGVVRLGLPGFLAIGLLGRLLRFTAILLAPRLIA